MPASSSLPAAQVIGVIPARLASTRLPRKVLRDIAGKPMLAWVYQAAASAGVFDRLIVATDADEVADLCQARGWECRMTSSALASGTDRVHAVAQELGGAEDRDQSNDIFVNIQGDEPLLRPQHFHALLRPFARPHVDVTTVMTPCPADGIRNPNTVKVVLDRKGRALDRLRRVAAEASAQCRRVWIPEVLEPQTLGSFLGAARVTGDIVGQAQLGGGLPEPGMTCLVVGPEGGWSSAELELGCPRVGLGPNVLRSETAAIVAGVILVTLRTGTVVPRRSGQFLERAGGEGGRDD